jgi:hypothetical protein
MGFSRVVIEGGLPGAPTAMPEFPAPKIEERQMTKAILISFALLVSLGAAASAQSPSRQDQIDCRPDAMRLCSTHVGKPDEMRMCLAQNKTKLSDACRKVVEARGG